VVTDPQKKHKHRQWRLQYTAPQHSVAQCRQLQEGAKDASVSECTWTLSALEALRNALYKFKTYLLTQVC